MDKRAFYEEYLLKKLRKYDEILREYMESRPDNMITDESMFHKEKNLLNRRKGYDDALKECIEAKGNYHQTQRQKISIEEATRYKSFLIGAELAMQGSTFVQFMHERLGQYSTPINLREFEIRLSVFQDVKDVEEDIFNRTVRRDTSMDSRAGPGSRFGF